METHHLLPARSLGQQGTVTRGQLTVLWGWGAQPLVQRPHYSPQSQKLRSPEPSSRGREPFTLRLDKTKSKPWVLCQLLFWP